MKIGKYDYARCNKGLACPICGREKYCLVNVDGSAVICTKIAEGAKRSYTFGHLHFLDDERERPVIKHRPLDIKPDRSKVYARYKQLDFSVNALRPLAQSLGIKATTLQLMGVGFDHVNKPVWNFPMYNAQKELIGLKCRDLNRNKWCVKHSKLGIYMAQTFNPEMPLMICEGESDTAAMIELGYNAVGRPSATCGAEILTELVSGRFVYIFADTDADGLGLDTSKSLAEKMQARVVYNPNHKDVREWIKAGGFRDMDWQKWIVS